MYDTATCRARDMSYVLPAFVARLDSLPGSYGEGIFDGRRHGTTPTVCPMPGAMCRGIERQGAVQLRSLLSRGQQAGTASVREAGRQGDPLRDALHAKRNCEPLMDVTPARQPQALLPVKLVARGPFLSVAVQGLGWESLVPRHFILHFQPAPRIAFRDQFGNLPLQTIDATEQLLIIRHSSPPASRRASASGRPKRRSTP